MDYNIALNAVRLGWVLTLIALVFNAWLYLHGVHAAVHGMALAVVGFGGSYFVECFRVGRISPALIGIINLVVIVAVAASHVIWYALAL